jgi:hypothetical protein
VKSDFQKLEKLNIDNISVHYLMNSNNIDYKLEKNYIDLIKQTKQFLKNKILINEASNITEDYFVSKRNTTIAI